MISLKDYTPSELATLATIIGIIISSKYNVNQQNVVGNFLEGVGQTMLIIAAQAQNLQPQSVTQGAENVNSNSNRGYKDLQKQMDELKNYIKKFEDNINH